MTFQAAKSIWHNVQGEMISTSVKEECINMRSDCLLSACLSVIAGMLKHNGIDIDKNTTKYRT